MASWQAFYAIAPFGDQRADQRSAIVAQTMHNVMIEGRPPPLEDFMPYSPEPDPEDRKKYLATLARFNARSFQNAVKSRK